MHLSPRCTADSVRRVSTVCPCVAPQAGSQLFGAIMMIVAMVGGAFKYVLCHKAISEFRKEMGVLGFTFWVCRPPLDLWRLRHTQCALIYPRVAVQLPMGHLRHTQCTMPMQHAAHIP